MTAVIAAIPGPRLDQLHEASELLLAARRTTTPIDGLPPELTPVNELEAFALQKFVAGALGEPLAWKVGASSPTAEPSSWAPIPSGLGVFQSGAKVGGPMRRYRGVEIEVAFKLGKDLPARQEPYSREEIAAAIASCHPAIELLETAYSDPDKVDALSRLGDLIMTGGLVYGKSVENWEQIDATKEQVMCKVDGVIRKEAVASNPGGVDFLRLIQWLANQGKKTGGLSAGQLITTGSWTGKTNAGAGSIAVGTFPSFGEVAVSFA